MFSSVIKTIELMLLTLSMVIGGRLVKRPDGWFITGRGCGGSTKIEFLGEIPENPTSLECVFIPNDPIKAFHKITGNNKCVYYEKTPMNFATGKAACEGLFGRMYEPRDEDHARKVYEYAAKIGYLPGTSHAGHTGPWIGISDVVTDGEFVYESDGKAVTMDHFMSGAPSGGAGNNCVNLWAPWDNNPNPWNDINCNEQLGTLCELDPEVAAVYGKECLFF